MSGLYFSFSFLFPRLISNEWEFPTLSFFFPLKEVRLFFLIESRLQRLELSGIVRI